MDNTPYWAVDPCRWDMAYMHFYRKYAEVRFDVSKQDTVQHLLSAIRQRGDRIYIGFTYYDQTSDRNSDEDIIQLAQFGGNICHSCVWFGEHVTTMAAGDAISMVQSPLNYGRWELVSLPFTNVPLAFKIGVDIVLKCNNNNIGYNDQRWSVLMHMVARLLIPGQKEVTGTDYDPDKPETWTHGVHCSQLTLLFLKRCVLHSALYIAPQHRERLMLTHSFTCLPVSLRALLAGIWGGSGQFRDYRHVRKEVRKAWYPHYYDRRDTKLLK